MHNCGLKIAYKSDSYCSCTENLLVLNLLPSDVITSYSGHSIEIIDTDAEDVWFWLMEYRIYLRTITRLFNDIATFYKQCRNFGYECGALFTNNESVSKQLQQVGDSIGERLWQLPLWDCYKQDIESDIADVKNYSGKPVAGAISAAKF
jgi:leucyl aminopeptidase